MAIAPIETTGPTITVSTIEELHEAYDTLSYTDGGGTILLEPGSYSSFSRYPYGVDYEENPVVIKSLDSDNPAELTGISLREISNLKIEGVAVDSTHLGLNDGTMDLRIQSCSNVQIVNCSFTQDSGNELKDAGEITEQMSHIRDSQNIVFSGNYVSGYLHALQVTEVDNMEINDNEITNILGDGFRGGGLQNLLIDGNYFHDFYPLEQSITHSDMIQIWGANCKTLTQNVTISNNTIIASDAATQSIFIRNEEFWDEGDSTADYYTDITIENNLIYNAHKWGIHLESVDGAVIDSNTVLWNQDAAMTHYGETFAYMPEIFARNSLNIEATNNIAGAVTVPDGSVAADNEIVTYSDPSEVSFVGNHFVNPLAGESASADDLSVLVSSPYYGAVGSSIGNSPNDVSEGVQAVITSETSSENTYEVTYDASASQSDGAVIDAEEGYSFKWTFADGTTAEGLNVTHTYEDGGFKGVTLQISLDGAVVGEVTRNFAIESKDIFAFDFEDGVVDVSGGAPDFNHEGSIFSHDGNLQFLIGDGKKLEISKSTEELFDLDTFGLALDLQPTGDEQSGVFLHLHETMTGQVLENGQVSFSLTTDAGTYSLESDEPIFDDGEMHRIGIAFDGTSGQLELFADGESVGATEAWGTTPPVKYWGLVFGNTWEDSMDAILDNIEMSVDPSVAGDLPDVDIIVDEEPGTAPPEPPVVNEEPPVVEEPPVAEEPSVNEEDETPPVDDVEAPVLVVDESPIIEAPVEEEEPEPIDDADDDKGNKSIISKILQAFLSIFGLGKKDDEDGESEEDDVEVATSAGMQLLTDILPATGAHDDTMPDEEDDEDDASFLDAA